jgi:transcriptional regulator with AAA-type ATPase domain
MDINDLPPEVLTKIFSYLPQLDLHRYSRRKPPLVKIRVNDFFK